MASSGEGVVDVGDVYGEEFASTPKRNFGKVDARAPRQDAPNVLTESSRARKPALRIPGLPVFVPESAMNPQVGPVAPAPGAGRDRDTIIVQRSGRGVAAMTHRSTEASSALRDFSAYHDAVVPTYNRNYINELAYCEASKAHSKEKRDLENDRQKRVDARTRSHFFAGHSKGGSKAAMGGESSGGGPGFFDRLEAMEKRLQEGRAEAKAEWDYNSQPDHLHCPVCGQMQSYAEKRDKQRKCTKDKCQGAVYRPKLLWSEVQDSFLGRWSADQVRWEENLKKLKKEVDPPFRIPGSAQPEWDSVRAAFYARNDEAVSRIEGRIAAGEAIRNKAADKLKPTKSKPYAFRAPLPDFYARQAAALEKKNATFEERYEMLQAL